MECVNVLFDENGFILSESEFKEITGVSIEISELHLKIKSETGWAKGCDRIFPNIGSINEGHLSLLGFHIFSKSFELPQQAFFFFLNYKSEHYVDKTVFGLCCEKGLSEVVKSMLYLKKDLSDKSKWFAGRDFDSSNKKGINVLHNVVTNECLKVPDDVFQKEEPEVYTETLYAFEKFVKMTINNFYPYFNENSIKNITTHLSTLRKENADKYEKTNSRN